MSDVKKVWLLAYGDSTRVVYEDAADARRLVASNALDAAISGPFPFVPRSEAARNCACDPLSSAPCDCRIAGAEQEREACAVRVEPYDKGAAAFLRHPHDESGTITEAERLYGEQVCARLNAEVPRPADAQRDTRRDMYQTALEKIATSTLCPRALYEVAADALCWARKHDVQPHANQPGDATLRHAVAWMRATFPDDRHAQGWAAELDHVFLGGPPRPTPEGFTVSVSWDEFERICRERDTARAEVLRLVSHGVAMPTTIAEMDGWKKRANTAEAAVYELNCRVAELKRSAADDGDPRTPEFGVGAPPGSFVPRRCPACDGRGLFSNDAAGYIGTTKCRACDGTGQRRESPPTTSQTILNTLKGPKP